MKTPTFNAVVTILMLTIIPLAFILKPLESGLDVYVLIEFFTLIALFVLPFFHSPWSAGKRILYALLLPIFHFIIWCLGFALADFRIMTRLF